MGYRKKKHGYGGYASWRQWRDGNATALSNAGVPTLDLESQVKWSFFVQEVSPEFMGGPRFDIEELTTEQLLLLQSLLTGLPEATPGMDLVDTLERVLRKRLA
jgi:hypothetical protein